MISFDAMMTGYNARALLERMCVDGELDDEMFLHDVSDALFDVEYGDEPVSLADCEVDPRMRVDFPVG